MKITIKDSTVVKPASETPQCTLWNSNIDMVIPRIHIPTVYFYKAKEGEDGSEHFECGHLKEALGKALVPFYPMAGRLKVADKGRVDIDCNGEGVLFVEATADGCIKEYGEFFAPCMKMRELIPQIDYATQRPSSFPLLLLQVTAFRCGGVCLGVGVHHHVADGLAALWFINYWADVARGVEEDVKPFFDRTLLRARDPPKPKFAHVEYLAPPPLLEAEDGVGHVKANGDPAKVNVDHRVDVQGDHAVANGGGGHVKLDGDGLKLDHAKVNVDHRVDVQGDHAVANGGGSHVKLDGDGLKLDHANDKNNINGDHIKINGDHSKLSGDYKSVSEDYVRTNVDHDNVNRDVSKVNGDYSCINGDHVNVNGDDIKVNGDNLNHHPSSKKLRTEDDEHERLLEEIAKLNEEIDDVGVDYGEGGPVVPDLFIFSKELVESLKSRATEHILPGDRPFTSYEVLSAHVWRCACLARKLQDAQLTKLYIATDGRSRLEPPLPKEYFGNVIFTSTPVERVYNIVNTSLADAVRQIRKTVQLMDDDYLRSAIDFLELQPNLACFSRGAHTFRTPNLGITSWVRLPIYGADFGWGSPLSMGPAGVPFEGLAYLLPGPPGDTRLRLSITLTPQHMRRFRELIYQF